MKKTLLLLVSCFLALASAHAQTFFAKIMQSGYGDGYSLIKYAPDVYFGYGARQDSIFIFRFDSTGNILWQKKYYFQAGFSFQTDYFPGFHRTVMKTDGTGNLFILGYYPLPSLSLRPVVIKLDTSGQVKWCRAYDFATAGNFYFTDLYVTAGNYYFTGKADSTSCDNYQGLLFAKTDTSGNVLWCKSYAAFNNVYMPAGYYLERGDQIIQLTDGNFFIAGISQNDTNTVRNVLFMKADTAGNLIWTKLFGDPILSNPLYTESVTSINKGINDSLYFTFFTAGSSDHHIDVAKAGQDGNVTAHIRNSYSSYNDKSFKLKMNGNDVFIVFNAVNVRAASRLQNNLNVLVDTWHQHPLFMGDIYPLSDSRYFLLGQYTAGNLFFGLANASGNTGCVTQTGNGYVGGGFINKVPYFPYTISSFQLFSNSVNVMSNSESGFYLICSPTGNDVSFIEPDKVILFPNPFTTQATITFGKEISNGIFRLYNLYGQMVLEENNINGESFQLNAETLGCSVYVFEVIEKEKKIYTGKAIIY